MKITFDNVQTHEQRVVKISSIKNWGWCYKLLERWRDASLIETPEYIKLIEAFWIGKYGAPECDQERSAINVWARYRYLNSKTRYRLKCKKGHWFTFENTMLKFRTRCCKKCQQIMETAYRSSGKRKPAGRTVTVGVEKSIEEYNDCVIMERIA